MGTNYSDGVVKFKCSRRSVRGFIKRYLAIEETDYWFHQTLTFKDNKTDATKAKTSLQTLLDLLRKQFPQMPALFVQERQKRLGLHYHVIFMLFGAQAKSPEDVRKELSGEIYDRWNKINGGKLCRQANLLTLPEKGLVGLAYLLKSIDPTGKGLDRATVWHGIRLGKVLNAHYKPVTRKAVSEAFDFVFSPLTFWNQLRPSQPEQHKFTKDSIAYMKAYLETTGAATDWKTFKRTILGRNVSDADLLAYFNSGASSPYSLFIK